MRLKVVGELAGRPRTRCLQGIAALHLATTTLLEGLLRGSSGNERSFQLGGRGHGYDRSV